MFDCLVHVWLAHVWLIGSCLTDWLIFDWLAQFWLISSILTDWLTHDWMAQFWPDWLIFDWLVHVWLIGQFWLIGSFFTWLAHFWLIGSIMSKVCKYFAALYIHVRSQNVHGRNRSNYLDTVSYKGLNCTWKQTWKVGTAKISLISCSHSLHSISCELAFALVLMCTILAFDMWYDPLIKNIYPYKVTTLL